MPMEKAEDYPGGDTAKDWCVHCAGPDGSLKTFDEAVTGMAAFMVQSQGLDESAAREAARTYLMKMPAWKGTETD
jgi:hypothetical protein